MIADMYYDRRMRGQIYLARKKRAELDGEGVN